MNRLIDYSTQYLVFPVSTCIDITLYQRIKCFVFLKCNVRSSWIILSPVHTIENTRLLCFEDKLAEFSATLSDLFTPVSDIFWVNGNSSQTLYNYIYEHVCVSLWNITSIQSIVLGPLLVWIDENSAKTVLQNMDAIRLMRFNLDNWRNLEQIETADTKLKILTKNWLQIDWFD